MFTMKKIALVILALLIWSAFVGLGFVNGFLLRPICSENTVEDFVTTIEEQLKHEPVGNFAMTLIENGEIAESYFTPKANP